MFFYVSGFRVQGLGCRGEFHKIIAPFLEFLLQGDIAGASPLMNADGKIPSTRTKAMLDLLQ